MKNSYFHGTSDYTERYMAGSLCPSTHRLDCGRVLRLLVSSIVFTRREKRVPTVECNYSDNNSLGKGIDYWY